MSDDHLTVLKCISIMGACLMTNERLLKSWSGKANAFRDDTTGNAHGGLHIMSGLERMGASEQNE
ncbi:hypothetical protein JHV666_39270 [Mycobacterium avium subsp. hominissuis]